MISIVMQLHVTQFISGECSSIYSGINIVELLELRRV